MATGTKSDLNVQNPFLHTALTERLAQFSDAFNAASNGAITLGTESKIGEADIETFFKNITGLVSRRDTTSVASATASKLVNTVKTEIKLDRKIGPVENTLSGFVKIGMTTDEMQFAIGEQAAVAMAVGMLNDGLSAVASACANVAGLLQSTAGPISSADLIKTMFKLGDRQDRVVVWVMHSYPYSQLIQSQLAANINGVSSFNLAEGTPITFGRPVIVTDSAALRVVNGAGAGNDYYYTLGLTQEAVELINSETENVIMDIVTGLENLVARVQGEYAFSLGLKGFNYSIANGGVNPNASALATGANWVNLMDDVKDLPGAVLRSQTA